MNWMKPDLLFLFGGKISEGMLPPATILMVLTLIPK